MDVSAGQNHTCAVRGDQSLWCWGQNTGQESGSGAPLGIVGAVELSAPTRVDSTANFIAIRGHTFHGCAIRSNLELWCWGRNAEGQLGTGDIDNRDTPAFVQPGIAAVSAGPFATCVATAEGSTLCAGKNEAGQLGTGDLERRREFTSVPLGSTPSP
jgi:alpha-tubulin suppressor-like RCC1 family protein